jgi:hypothetical protein
MSEKLTCSNDTLPDQSLPATAKDLQVGHFRTHAAAWPPNASSDRFPPDTVNQARGRAMMIFSNFNIIRRKLIYNQIFK